MYCIRKHTLVFKNDRPGACLTKYYGLIWAESLIWVTKMAIRDGIKAIALKNDIIRSKKLRHHIDFAVSIIPTDVDNSDF